MCVHASSLTQFFDAAFSKRGCKQLLFWGETYAAIVVWYLQVNNASDGNMEGLLARENIQIDDSSNINTHLYIYYIYLLLTVQHTAFSNTIE